jgi:hypothetical protein
VWAILVAIRAIRLLLIFNITKYKLQNDIDIDENDASNNNQKAKRPFWAVDPKWVTTPYLLLIFFLIWIVFLICFPMAISIWFVNHFGGITKGTVISGSWRSGDTMATI